LETKVELLERLTSGFKLVDDPSACTKQNGKLLQYEGNFRIVNGKKNTESTNSCGNFILGYNEDEDAGLRTGSHNLVLG